MKTSDIGKTYCPYSDSHVNDPYSFYARARQQEPTFFSPDLGCYVVTRYEDVHSVLKQPEVFSSKDVLRPRRDITLRTIAILLSTGQFKQTLIQVNSDGVNHLRFRAAFNKVFAPARVAAMEEFVRQHAHGVVDEFVRDGNAELIGQFISPFLAKTFIQIIGIPETMTAQCIRWSDDIHRLFAQRLSREHQAQCARGVASAYRYLYKLLKKRRTDPDAKDDLFRYCLTEQYGQEQRLQPKEIVNQLVSLLSAGQRTTTYAMGNAVQRVLSDPKLCQAFRDSSSLIPGIVEESLRIDSAAQGFYRTATKDVVLGDKSIPKGSLLLVVFGSANRDSDQFAQADCFDPNRYPNQHLAFGYGPHFCIGAPLARLEMRVGLEVLRERLPKLRLKPSYVPSYLPDFMFRGLGSLDVEWD